MIARLALLLALVVVAHAAPPLTKMERHAQYFLSIYQVRQVGNTATALYHFNGIRKFNVQATNFITAHVRNPQTSLYNALGKVATVAEADAKIAAYRKDEADMVAILPSEQEHWLVVVRQGSGFLRKFTGNAQLEADLNALHVAKVQLFESKLYPENRKLFDAAVQRFRDGLGEGKASHNELYRALYVDHEALSIKLQRAHMNAKEVMDEKIGVLLAIDSCKLS